MGTATEEPLVPRTGLPSAQHKVALRSAWKEMGFACGTRSWEAVPGNRGSLGVGNKARQGSELEEELLPRGPKGPREGQLRSLGGCAEARSPGDERERGCSPHLIGQGLTIGLQCSSTQGPSRPCRRPHAGQGSSWAGRGQAGPSDGSVGRSPRHRSWQTRGTHCPTGTLPNAHPHTPVCPGAAFFSLSRWGQMNPGLPASTPPPTQVRR